MGRDEIYAVAREACGMPGQPVMTRNFGTNMGVAHCASWNAWNKVSPLTLTWTITPATSLTHTRRMHKNGNITMAYKNADAYVQPQSMSPQLCTVGVFMYSKAYAHLAM